MKDRLRSNVRERADCGYRVVADGLILLALLLPAPAAAQDASTYPSAEIRPDIARAFKRKVGEVEPPPAGFVFLDAYVASEPDTFPPKGIEGQHLELGVCPLVRLTVPVERVVEIRALLQSMAPTPSDNCGRAKF
jgi:hypothetical protein